MTLAPFPPFGMGTASIGNLYAAMSDACAEATVVAAWDGGMRLFDTAPYYGFGLAERRLGQALATADPRGAAIVSTKVGRVLVPHPAARGERHGFVDGDPFEPRFDYSRDGVLRSHEASLTRLRRDRVAILLAHDLGTRTHGANADRHMRDFLDGGYRAMADLKAAGAVDAIGIGVNETAVCEDLIGRVDLDVVMVAGRYTLLDQQAQDRLLAMCLRSGVRMLAAAPYNSGVLARSTDAEARRCYDYAIAPPDMIERAAAIERVCAEFGVSLSTTALRFPGRHSGVASVIVGLAGPDEVAVHLARATAPIPEALWRALASRGLLSSDQSLRGAAMTREPQLLLLDSRDTILVCVAPVAVGEWVMVDGAQVQAREAVEVGHKVARTALEPGDKVIKYGAPIGSITVATARGAPVHLHNMKSDYIAAHSRASVSEGKE